MYACPSIAVAKAGRSYGLFAGDGFTIVVLDSFFSAGLVTFVSFFSHATNTEAINAKQIYFFMSNYRGRCQAQSYQQQQPRV
jgi:hypothetical protein